MSFDRDRLPDSADYFEEHGMRLTGPGVWKTTGCVFHGGSDSMRVNTKTGGWCCMACEAKGGDVLSFHMQAYGLEFVDAAKAIGCWIDDDKPVKQQKPAPLPPRQALQVISFEATLTAIAAGNIARGVALTDVDLARVMAACNRITRLVEAYA
jgi:CHC2 zinc finger